jgi:zona occludens toxin
MINGLEGIPGSGKSYEAVVMHVLPALKAGRKVITNLPLLVMVLEAISPSYAGLVELRTKSQPVLGSWDAEAVDDKGNGEAFTLYSAGYVAEPVRNVPVFGAVWDYYSDWKHPETGQGPLFIIDEAHLALPVQGTSQEVIEWFKLHRHFNADVLLATQSFRDINQPIARLLAILIKCRKADILGKPKSYIRKVHAGYRGAVISTEERKYEPQYFGLYRSHTQGNSVGEALASDVSPLIVKLRRFTWFWWVITIAFAVWAFWPKPKGKVVVVPVASSAVVPGAASVALPRPAASGPVLAVSPDTAEILAAAAAAAAQTPEPLAGKLVHVTGWMKNAHGGVYTFSVSAGGVRLFDITAAELVAAGYVWRPLAECMGYLSWHSAVKPVTCDAPVLASGSQNAPVVMDFHSGKKSTDVVASK